MSQMARFTQPLTDNVCTAEHIKRFERVTDEAINAECVLWCLLLAAERSKYTLLIGYVVHGCVQLKFLDSGGKGFK